MYIETTFWDGTNGQVTKTYVGTYRLNILCGTNGEVNFSGISGCCMPHILAPAEGGFLEPYPMGILNFPVYLII